MQEWSPLSLFRGGEQDLEANKKDQADSVNLEMQSNLFDSLVVNSRISVI